MCIDNESIYEKDLEDEHNKYDGQNVRVSKKAI